LRIGSQREAVWRYKDDILQAFDRISDVVRASSRAIHHHHAMALWKTAGYDRSLPPEQVETRFGKAIRLLGEALKIPSRTHERDEHPGHILTTRAYALWRWSEQVGDVKRRGELETESINDFRRALREILDNRYAMYGLARALITVCEAASSVETIGPKAAMIAEALDLLQGDPAPDFAVNWRTLQEKAIRLIDSSAPADFRSRLRDGNEEAGYLLEAWGELAGDLQNASNENKKRALYWLDNAIDNPEVECTWRTYYSAYRLSSAHPEFAIDFQRKYELLRMLERMPDFILKAGELFDLGVLSYLLDHPKDGAAFLRKLRVSGMSRDIQTDSLQYWTEIEPPFRPRSATLRVKRIESPYRGWGFIPELDEDVPFTPTHFEPSGQMSPGTPLRCYIRFFGTGAKAVPERFYREPTKPS